MRLYLSSFRLGLHPAELVRLAGGRGAPVAVVSNALDGLGADRDPEREARELVDLRAVGLVPEELDLRDHVGDPEGVGDRLAHVGLCWVRGGNTFVLRRAMLAAGFDEAARPLIEAGALAYGGYSAGACVLAPTLRGIELVDDPHVVPPGADPTVPWDGVGLLDVWIVPHVDSLHPESAAMDAVVARYRADGTPHVVLRDGEVLLVEDGTRRLLTW